MNLDELRSVQNKERQTDSLQHLRESFYSDVSQYITELEAERDSLADDVEDPFGNPDVRRLSDEIDTAREVVEAIYQRRLGKLVKRASLTAAADAPADEDGLTAEEADLFDDLVERIRANKTHVLDVIDDDTHAEPVASPPAEGSAGADKPATAPGQDDLVAEEARAVTEPEDLDRGSPDGSDREETPGDDGGTRPADWAEGPADAAETEGPTGEAGDEVDDGAPDTAGLDTRTTVRITGDVDQFYGVDEREYDLEPETVVTLPSENAEPLLNAGDAERVD